VGSTDIHNVSIMSYQEFTFGNSVRSRDAEQYPRHGILEPLCHDSVEIMMVTVNGYYLEHWPFPYDKARRKFTVAEFPRVTCLYFPKALQSRIQQACSLLSILFLIDGTRRELRKEIVLNRG
jgi:hypothetical protein